MRQINPYPLWIGHVGDVDRPASIADLGIEAVVDLADNEKAHVLFRDMVYCRIPLVDGAENPQPLLALAVDTVVRLIQAKIPTLVFCSNGLSRSPAIAATAISVAAKKPLSAGLEALKANGSFDVSPSLWAALEAAYPPRSA